MSAFRAKIREALGLPLDIEEEGGAGGTGSGGTGSGSTGGSTGGTTSTGSDGSVSDGGMTDGGTDGDGDSGTDTPEQPKSIGHGFPLGWWRMGSYHKDRCPDGKHRDPKTGDCKKK